MKMWNDPAMREIVWEALPVAGVTGRCGTACSTSRGHRLLRAKTGTTNIASALSGYVGRPFAFVAIENGHPVDYWAAHEAEDGVAKALLAELNPSSSSPQLGLARASARRALLGLRRLRPRALAHDHAGRLLRDVVRDLCALRLERRPRLLARDIPRACR